MKKKQYIKAFVVADSHQLLEENETRRFFVDKFVREEVLVNGVWELRRSWGLSVVEILDK